MTQSITRGDGKRGKHQVSSRAFALELTIKIITSSMLGKRQGDGSL